jgi:hypothetical protein
MKQPPASGLVQSEPQDAELWKEGESLASELGADIYVIFSRHFERSAITLEVLTTVLLECSVFAALYVEARAKHWYSEDQIKAFMGGFEFGTMTVLIAEIGKGLQSTLERQYRMLVAERQSQFVRFYGPAKLKRAQADLLLRGRVRISSLDGNFLSICLQSRPEINQSNLPISLLQPFALDVAESIQARTHKFL